MAEPLLERFTQEVVTERELKKLMPDWPNTLIRDYLAFKRNIFITAEIVEDINARLDAIELRLIIIEAELIVLAARIAYLEGTIVVTAVNVTAAGNTTIICTAAVTVSLSTTPLDKDLVSIKAINGDKIIINGNGKTIDGEASVTIRQNKSSKIKTGLTMRYSSSLSGWVLL